MTSCSLYENALMSFQSAEYEVAIKEFEKYLSKNPKNRAEINFRIAECYRLSNRLPQAKTFYEKTMEIGGFQHENLAFYYAYSLKVNQEYEKAAAAFEKYLEKGRNADFIRQAKTEIANMKTVAEIAKTDVQTTIKPLENVNSVASEFAPTIFGKNVIFASSRRNEATFKSTGTGFQDLYALEILDTLKNTGNFAPNFFNENINLEGQHEASATFSADGKTMIFARGNKGEKDEPYTDVQLFSATFDEKLNTWTVPKMMERISRKDAWNSCPALSPDGKTLYFASNRKDDSQGGVDIYFATKDKNGVWGNVQNAGKLINTAGNELFPYIDKKGKFFFASDGQIGLGGLDLFKIDTVLEKTTKNPKVVNLGVPINSVSDDFGIVFRNKNDGYFSSNRAGGQGDDDIFSFHNDSANNKKVVYYLQGTSYATVKERKGTTQQILANTSLKLIDNQGKTVDTQTSDANGKFKFTPALDMTQTYTVFGEKASYLHHSVKFPTKGREVKDVSKLPKRDNEIWFDTLVVLQKNILDGAIPELEILYEYDSSRITSLAAVELDEFTDFLVDYFEQFPNQTLELGSHTDARGSAKYNEKLAQRRAEAAVRYIVSKGIDSQRIVAKGYGEYELKIKVAKTESEHQINRRTTIKIISR